MTPNNGDSLITAATETMLDRIAKNAQPNLEGGQTPIEQAAQAHAQLVKDNLELVKEFRVVLHERDLLQAQLEHERETHQMDLERYAKLAQTATDQCHQATQTLTRIQTHLRTAGDQLLRAVKIAEDATDDNPEGVKDFRPNLGIDKTSTAERAFGDQGGAHAED